MADGADAAGLGRVEGGVEEEKQLRHEDETFIPGVRTREDKQKAAVSVVCVFFFFFIQFRNESSGFYSIFKNKHTHKKSQIFTNRASPFKTPQGI